MKLNKINSDLKNENMKIVEEMKQLTIQIYGNSYNDIDKDINTKDSYKNNNKGNLTINNGDLKFNKIKLEKSGEAHSKGKEMK